MCRQLDRKQIERISEVTNNAKFNAGKLILTWKYPRLLLSRAWKTRWWKFEGEGIRRQWFKKSRNRFTRNRRLPSGIRNYTWRYLHEVEINDREERMVDGYWFQSISDNRAVPHIFYFLSRTRFWFGELLFPETFFARHASDCVLLRFLLATRCRVSAVI